MKKKSESRREFLLKGFSNKGKLISDIASLIREDDVEPDDKVKMLTADGKLVEVDRRFLKNNLSTSKTSNAEILKWMKGEEEE